MKRLNYEWDNEIWLLHVEVKNSSGSNRAIVYSRILGKEKDNKDTTRIVLNPSESRRFIISRKGIDEMGMDIRFDEGILMRIFRLQDRAYFPGDSDMVFSNGEKE